MGCHFTNGGDEGIYDTFRCWPRQIANVQFRNGVDPSHIFCVMYSLIIHFGIQKYELSLNINIGLLHRVTWGMTAPGGKTLPLL